jgi:hypothetical protein
MRRQDDNTARRTGCKSVDCHLWCIQPVVLSELYTVDWTEVAQDTDRWAVLVKTVTITLITQNAGNFLDQLGDCYILKDSDQRIQ